MQSKLVWGWGGSLLLLMGIGVWGCQSESAPQPAGRSAKPDGSLQDKQEKIAWQAAAPSLGGPEQAQKPFLAGQDAGKLPQTPPQSPQWWRETSAQGSSIAEISPPGRKPEPPSREQTSEIEKPSRFPSRPGESPAAPGSSETPFEAVRPNPLREGPSQEEPLRPEPIRLEMGPQESGKSVSPEKPGPSAPESSQGALRSEVPAGPSGPLSASPTLSSTHRPAFDPYKEHGQFFVGWPKPKLALVLTGSRQGYIEPCGCAGKDRMKGGISRLHSMLLELRQKRGWPTVALDVGGISKGAGLQGVLKFHALVDAMRRMGYDAAGFGLSDLKYDLGDLIAVASEVDGKPGLFISSNVALLGWDAGFTGKPRVIEAGGLKIGVIAVLGREFQKEILSKEILFEDPEKAARQQAAELRPRCDVLILLAHASRQESLELAKKVGPFDLVVTSGGAPEPPAQPQPIEGQKGWLIEVGEKGMYAAVVGMYDDPQQPRRYQRVVLDSRYPDSEAMRQIMAAYQEQLKDLGLKGLGLQPVRHPRQELNGPFVGSQQCESCHEPSYKVWKRSGHAKAWETLVRADPPRHHDPECISCHVVGWNAQKYFPYQSGFWSEKQTPDLVAVGCESCHGPGGRHVQAELGRLGADPDTKQKYRQAMVLPLAEAEKTCLECHDLDNSPDFQFKTYWPKVEHRED